MRFPILTSVLLFTLPLLANTQVVTTLADEDDSPPGAQLSLREAIANADDTDSVITFNASLTSGRIILQGSDLEIDDPDPFNATNGTLTLDASALDEPIIISGQSLTGETEVITVNDRSLILKNIIIEEAPRHGISATFGDSHDVTLEDCVLRNNGASGVNFTSRTLTIERCEVHGNGRRYATGESGAYGVRFYFGRSLEARSSSIYHNFGGGMGISGNSGRFFTAIVSNCTVAENTAAGQTSDAAGIETNGAMGMIISDCTIVDNVGGGLAGRESLRLYNCIVARNLRADATALLNIIDSPLSPIDSGGFNLTDSNPSSLDHVDDVKNTDPMVSRLGYFGGPVLTCYPMAGSPVIDGGNPNHSIAFYQGFYDGRGFERNAKSSTNSASTHLRDIGAVEVDTSVLYTVNSTGTDGPATLDTMLAAPGASHRRITFAPSMSGATIPVNSIEILNNAHIDFDASNLAEPVTFEATNNQRGFWIWGNATASFQNCRFTTVGTTAAEPGVFIWPGSKAGFSRCVFEDSQRTQISIGTSAGLRSRLHLNECRFSGNTAVNGPAIQGGTLAPPTQVWNTTFSGNEVTSTGASAAITTFSGNSRAIVHFRNSTFDGDDGGLAGSGIWGNACRLNIDFCTFADFAGKAAITLQAANRDRITNSLFAGIVPSGAGSNGLVHIASTASPAFFEGNWVDAAGHPPAIATEGSFGLAPLGHYGGEMPTRPLLVGASVSGANPDAVRRALDAHRSNAGISTLPTPGAVWEPVIVVSSDLGLKFLEIDGAQARLEITADPSLDLQMYGGTDLSSLAPLGSNFSTSSTAPEDHLYNLPQPLPAKYFFQLREAGP